MNIRRNKFVTASLMITIFLSACSGLSCYKISETHSFEEVWKTENSKGSQEKQGKNNETQEREEYAMKISVKSRDYEIIYELNNSQAAKDLYTQLPLTLEVKDFSTNEKTFYPPKELNINDAPAANAEKGSLCYYSPWADVVMFYDYFGKGSSLYELGKVVEGKEDIEKLSGKIEITAIKNGGV